nr:TetR family transcriptional regulator [Nocardia jejuensis]
MTSTPERRTLIVDCAIDLIAAQGLRALTHRALDTALDLPPGSTSYYFRTKRRLIEAVVERIALRSRIDFAAANTLRPPPGGPGEPADPNDPAILGEPDPPGEPAALVESAVPHDPPARTDADIPARNIATWLDQLLAHRRTHLITRHALIIDLLGDPTLHERLTGCLFSHRHATSLFRSLGSTDPETRAADFIAVIEGLIFDRFAGARTALTPGTPASVDQLARVLAVHLTGSV